MNNSKGQLKLFNNTVISINRSSVNRSTAKSLYSFGKAQRFQKVQCPPYFYHKSKTEPNVSETVAKIRLPTIPKEDRTFYFNKQKETSQGPSPNSYQIKNENQIWKIKRRGDLMGSRRNKTVSVQKIPGPMDYVHQDFSRKSYNKSSTFFKSLRDTSQFFKIKGTDSPGPKYELISDFTSKKTLNYALNSKQQSQKKRGSKFHSNLSSKINRLSTQLLEKELVNSKQKSLGDSQDSSRKRPMVPTITSAKRKYLEMGRSSSPGPGEYASFSQFTGWA